jgi:hypothetical protein
MPSVYRYSGGSVNLQTGVFPETTTVPCCLSFIKGGELDVPDNIDYLFCLRRHAVQFKQPLNWSSLTVPHLARSLLPSQEGSLLSHEASKRKSPNLASTGVPFGPVNLQTGVLPEETTVPGWPRAFVKDAPFSEIDPPQKCLFDRAPAGIPFGSVNLQTGVPPEETTVTSTAGGGTLALEFGLLSRLTGDPGQSASRASAFCRFISWFFRRLCITVFEF